MKRSPASRARLVLALTLLLILLAACASPAPTPTLVPTSAGLPSATSTTEPIATASPTWTAEPSATVTPPATPSPTHTPTAPSLPIPTVPTAGTPAPTPVMTSTPGAEGGGGEMAREEAGIVVERCLDRYDFSAFRPGDIITVTLAVTNANDAELRGFYFSDQAPNGWIVNTAGVSVNAWTIADYAYSEGVADEVYDGYTPHRWELGMAVFSDSEPDLIEHAIRRKAE